MCNEMDCILLNSLKGGKTFFISPNINSQWLKFVPGTFNKILFKVS